MPGGGFFHGRFLFSFESILPPASIQLPPREEVSSLPVAENGCPLFFTKETPPPILRENIFGLTAVAL